MNNYKLSLIFLILFGCDNTTKNSVNNISSAKKQVKTEVNFDDFPKNWQRLTEIDEELVLFYPCSGGDRSFQFSQLSNGNWLINFYHNGQFVNLLVKELNKVDKNYFLEAIDRKTNDIIIFKLEDFRQEKGLAYWSWTYKNKRYEYAYVPFKSNKKFKVVYQPCSECPDIPCDDVEIKEGIYEATLPYKFSLDGNDFREMDLTINKDSTVVFKIFYYPENMSEKGDIIKFYGKASIDTINFTIEFENFNEELRTYFNEEKESNLEFLNDSVFRFNKKVDGLIIDDSFCENWEKKKHQN